MKKRFIVIALILFCAFNLHAQCNEQKSFGYGNLGTIGCYPTLGGGFRMQHGCHGFDLSGKFTPWKTFPVAEVRGLYLFYPKQSKLYLGAGPGFIREAERFPHGSISFDAALGYQWTIMKGRTLFFQIEGVVPLKNHNSSLKVWPAVTFGVAF